MLSLFLLVWLFGVSLSCPMPNSTVLFRGKCFAFVGTCSKSDADCHDSLRRLCAEEGQFPPIFEQESDISAFISIVPEWADLPSALTCIGGNYTWMNGERIAYYDRFYNGQASPYCSNQLYHVLNYDDGKFHDGFYSANTRNYCYGAAYKDPFCGDFEKVSVNNNGNSTCIKVFPTPMKWTDAEEFCKARGSHLAVIHSKQINDYIRRSAVAHGFQDGVHIGLTYGFDGIGWSDGTPMDYTNYEHGFPNPSMGYCGMMSAVLGKWINVDCAAAVSPFVCTKPLLVETPISSECMDTEYRSGDHIYSPGFPVNASIPCEYFLEAPTGKVVELEIVFLEANLCCDELILEDNTIGGNVIANLTGFSRDHKVYRSTSPYMWVHWRPSNADGVRGFHAIFRVADF